MFGSRVMGDTLYLNLFTTGRCSNACSYCIESDYLDEIDFPIEMMPRLLAFVRAQDRPNLIINFYGGEPSEHPQICEMMNIVKNEWSEAEIRMTTNLQKSFDFYDALPVNKYLASLHPYKVKDWDDWLNRAIKLDASVDIMVNDLICFAKVMHVFIMSSLYGYEDVYICPTDEFRATREFDVVKTQVRVRPALDRGFKGMFCNAGFDVDQHGRVMKCARQRKVLHNVFFDDPKKLEFVHVCKSSDCPGDLYFDRWEYEDTGDNP